MSDAPVFPRSRPRVDAHVHLSRWWPDIRRTGYRADLDYSVAGLLSEMDRSRIDYALAIQLFQAPSEVDGLAEGRSLYDESHGRLLPIATVDPTKGTLAVRDLVSRLEQENPLYGVKLFPGYRPFYVTDSRLDPVYELAHRRGLPVLIHQGDTLDGQGLIKFARPLDVDEVAGRFRDVHIVLCHLGNPWVHEAAEILYKNPNVYADTSGLLPSPTAPYFDAAVEKARGTIQEAIVASGAPDRFLYGSDWPLEELELAVDLIESMRLKFEDVARIMGTNAVQLFHLESFAPPG